MKQISVTATEEDELMYDIRVIERFVTIIYTQLFHHCCGSKNIITAIVDLCHWHLRFVLHSVFFKY